MTRLPLSATTASRLSLLLIGLAVVALAVRSLSVAEPLGIDQSLWASAVRGLSHGQLLYRDVWEQRPPGIYLTYLAAFSVFGWTTATVGVMDVVATSLTTLAIYGLGRSLAGRTPAALAAALYAVLTMPAWLYRYGGFLERSVCETFIVTCVALGALCLVRARRRRTLGAMFGFGVCLGAAVVFKPNAALYFPLLLCWNVMQDWPIDRGARGAVWRSGAVAVLGASVLPLVTVFWLWRLGLMADARTAVIDFNRWYVAAGFELSTYAVAFSKAVWLRMKTDPLWLAGGIASVAAVSMLIRERRLAPLPALAVLWGGGAVLVIVVNGARLFNSYFIQAFAPLSLLVAWWLTAGAAGSTVRRVAGVGTIGLMLFVLVQRHYVSKVSDVALADASVLLGRMDRVTYLDRFGGYGSGRGYSARANDELATYVHAHTEPSDRVFLFGINGAGIYFLADRLTAHRFLRVNFFVPADFPDPAFTLRSVIADLRVRRPRYLIFEALHSGSPMASAVDALPEQPEVQSLLEPYVLDARIEDFALYRLR